MIQFIAAQKERKKKKPISELFIKGSLNQFFFKREI